MTLSNQDFVTAVTKLNDLTRTGSIKWHLAQPVKLGESTGAAYETEYGGQKLRLVEYLPPRVRGFYTRPPSSERVVNPMEYKDIVIEIIDDQGIPIYEFPRVQGLGDFFETVRYQLADVEKFIKSLASAT